MRGKGYDLPSPLAPRPSISPTRLVILVRADDRLNQRVPDDVVFVQVNNRDALEVVEPMDRVDQAAARCRAASRSG